MAKPEFVALFDHYEEIIRDMEKNFNSHEFILKLAKRYQAEYIDALYAHRDSDAFRIVHQTLSNRLHEHSDLVRHDGIDPDTKDIFGNTNWCAKWAKVDG